MATIVRHKEDGNRYILLGAGFGMFKATRPSFFLGNLLPTEEKGGMSLLALCDGSGDVRWAASTELEVISVDGQVPKDVLSAGT